MTGINTLRQEENSKQNIKENKKHELLENLDIQKSKELIQTLMKNAYVNFLTLSSLRSTYDLMEEEWKQIQKNIEDLFSNKTNMIKHEDIHIIKAAINYEIRVRNWEEGYNYGDWDDEAFEVYYKINKEEMIAKNKGNTAELENALKVFEELVKK